MGKTTDYPGQHIDFIKCFKSIEYPRQIKKSLPPLEESLFLLLCAVLSRADDWVAIVLLGRKR